MAFETIATDEDGKTIVAKERKAPPLRKNMPAKYNTKKQQRARELLQAGYSIQEAAEIAGYSKVTIKKNMEQILRNIVPDAVVPHLRALAAIGNLRAITTADEMLDNQDPKWKMYGAKILTENAKIHLTNQDTPTTINFSFQTNVQFNQKDDEKE